MIKRIVTFYGLAFVATIALAGLQSATGSGQTQFILPQWGPGIAALLMLLLFRKDGIRLRPGATRDDLPRWVAALALPLLVAVAMLPAVNRFLLPVDVGASLGTLTPLWLAGMLFGALGEEIGWRGYLQATVRPRLSPLNTSLLVGALWAIWHMQMWANGPLYLILFVSAMAGVSVVITALIDDRPGGRLSIAVLFHLGINVGNVLFFDMLATTGFMALYAAMWVLVAAVAVYIRRDLFLRRPAQGKHAEAGAA